MFARLLTLGRWLGVLALVALTVTIAAEVVSRVVFSHSIEFVEELSGVLLVAITFLSAAESFASGSFMRVDVLLERLPVATQRKAERLHALLAGLFCLVLTVLMAGLTRSSWVNGVVTASFGGIPLWLPQLVLPVGTGFLSLACLRAALRPGAGATDSRLPGDDGLAPEIE